MPKFYMMCGPSGCGKSTYAGEIWTLMDGVMVATDGIRREIWGDASDQRGASKVFGIAYERIKAALSHGEDVIFDATNLRAAVRKQLVQRVREWGATWCACVAFRGDVADCIANQKLRDRQVPVNVVQSQYLNYQFPTSDEDWDTIIVREFYKNGR